MNINPTTSTNFTMANKANKLILKTTHYSLPTNKGSMSYKVTGSLNGNKITEIRYTLNQGNSTISEVFQNKKGFSPERLDKICITIQQKTDEGFKFLKELLEAQKRRGA